MAKVIVLHGGPRDNEQLEIGDGLFHEGRFKCYIPPTAAEMAAHISDIFVDGAEPSAVTIPVKTGFYIRKQFAMGLFGTCEYRTWDEWHWQE